MGGSLQQMNQTEMETNAFKISRSSYQGCLNIGAKDDKALVCILHCIGVGKKKRTCWVPDETSIIIII